MDYKVKHLDSFSWFRSLQKAVAQKQRQDKRRAATNKTFVQRMGKKE